jgi:predicted porin
VKKIFLLSAAAVVSIAASAHAGELQDIKAQSEQLREQNELLTKKLGDLEKRQRRLEARPVASAGAPADAMGAYTKAPIKKAAADDSLTWHGVTLYGAVDMGLTYQTHGAPLSALAGAGLNYLIAKNSNKSYFGVGPNALSASFVGLKGEQELVSGWNGIFNLQSGFNPQSGRFSDGVGSIVQNNFLPQSQQNSFADSARDGQVFNIAAYAGVSSPIYGTFTYGRQNSLTSDGVAAYDPQNNSSAFSVIGFQGATGGAGATENRILDNSLKYTVKVGAFRASAATQLSAGDNTAVQGLYQGGLGFDIAGFSFDGIYSHTNDAVTSAPIATLAALGTTSPNLNDGKLVAGTVSDNNAFMLLAKYTVGQFRFSGGYENIRFSNPSNALAPGAFVVGDYALGTANNTAFASDRILQVFWGGVRYAVRPDLDLALGYYHQIQNSFHGGTAATANAGLCADASLAQCKGTLDAISFTADWRFSKHVDMYAGAMWSQVNGGLANGDIGPATSVTGKLIRNTVDPTVGLRYRF